MAAGAVNTVRQLGYAFGIAVLGSVFAARIAHVVTAGRAHSSLAGVIARGRTPAVLAAAPPRQRGQLDTLIHAASAAGLNAALTVAGAAELVGAVVAVTLIRGQRNPAAQSAPTSTSAEVPGPAPGPVTLSRRRLSRLSS